MLATNFGVGSKEDAEDDYRITRWKWFQFQFGGGSDKYQDLLRHEGDLSLTFSSSGATKVGGHSLEPADVLVRIAENPGIRFELEEQGSTTVFQQAIHLFTQGSENETLSAKLSDFLRGQFEL